MGTAIVSQQGNPCSSSVHLHKGTCLCCGGSNHGRGTASVVCFQKGNFSTRHLKEAARVWPRHRPVHGGDCGWSRHSDAVDCRCKGNAEDEASSSNDENRGWRIGGKRMQASLAKLGDPFMDFVNTAGKKLQAYFASHQKEEIIEVIEQKQEELEWDRWQLIFQESEEQEQTLSILKYELEEALEKEDYREASLLRNKMNTIQSNDAVAEVLGELNNALEEERYSDAARLRDGSAAGLVGWWAGVAEEGNDPFGRIINITSAQGRLVARGYSARQLVTAGSGVPLFEVFYRKDAESGYQQQAVYLQRERSSGKDSSTLDGVDMKLEDVVKTETENGSESEEPMKDAIRNEIEVMDSENEQGDKREKGGKGENEVKDDKENVDEGLSKILSFLRGRMPDVKLKVFQVTNPEKEQSDKISNKVGDQLKLPDEKKKKNEEEVGGLEDGEKAAAAAAAAKNAVTAEELFEVSLRILIGRLMQSVPEDKIPSLPVRVPARIDYQAKDKFVFHIEGEGSKLSNDAAVAAAAASSWKMAISTTQSSSPELTPENASKVLSKGLPVKVSKEVADIIRLAVGYAQRRRGLSKSTSFHRIHLAKSTTDPFNALYVGTLAPYNSQVLQLRVRHGNWQEDEDDPSGDMFDFIEYVEAVKLVGDLHVPAGQVIFRARTGRGCRLPHRGVYPDELGVIARYRGRGKIAEPGFKNAHWIDGELLLLDGKGVGFLNGAQLCFVYSVPGQPYLILFRRANV